MSAEPRTKRTPKAPYRKAIEKYYAALKEFDYQGVLHEGAVSSAFQNLLADTARLHKWVLIPQLTAKYMGETPGPDTGRMPVLRVSNRPDGTLKDAMYLVRGHWEAKDSSDDLDVEIEKKRRRGYPFTNIIFEDTRRAVLFQNGKGVLEADVRDPARLAELLEAFYGFVEPQIETFEKAVGEFKERVPDLARYLQERIKDAHRNNKRFQAAFDSFFTLCRTALNPNIAQAAVDEMLIQHLLTERLIREVFDNPEFTRRNVIAAEVEKVIDALTSRGGFNRGDFLRELDRFYIAIENAARTMPEYADKQHFLNTVYERFFQGYSVKLADTHGIVYTPQPIVDFMCASVAEVLEKEFGKPLGHKDVFILDPCTGTGNFIVNLLRRIPKRDLPRVYREQLFANEIMLLPYYIAALNIEHAYYEQTGEYEPFEGLCFVDTLDMADASQHELGFMTEANTERVSRQRRAPITVVIGNPPYNANQADENDNNKNRKYPEVDQRIRDTYIRVNSAQKTKLYDPYVRFFRWATDRLAGRDGIVCFVTNNSFVHQRACDGLQKAAGREFTSVYHLDLQGNVRHNPDLSGTAYNVFGIQVGVGITIAVRRGTGSSARIFYKAVNLRLRREEKLGVLTRTQSLSHVSWEELKPSPDGCWFPLAESQVEMVPIASKQVKQSDAASHGVLFKTFGLGVSTNRDEIAYGFAREDLLTRVERFCEVYLGEVDRYRRRGQGRPIDAFIDHTKTKWSRNLKRSVANADSLQFEPEKLRTCCYRPFTPKLLYFAEVVVDELGQLPRFSPGPDSESENRLIVLTAPGSEKPFLTTMATGLIDLHLVGAGAGSEAFPFYVYDEDGSNRRENITDWALGQFREHYGDKRISKWDIFYYVYGLLHHPGYRSKFADNLKRELPRIPFAPAVGDPPHPPLGKGGRKSAACCAQASSSPPDKGRQASSSPPLNKGGARGGLLRPQGDGRSRLSTQYSALSSSGFWAFAEAGKALAELHLKYEELEPWPLKWVETPGEPLSYRVEKMKLTKDKTAVVVNKSLTLDKIPKEVFDYRLGNRSALEWVIDQYQVSTDKRSGITSDPNRDDDPEYIVRLVGQVVRVSIETVKIVSALPAEYA